MSSCGRQGCGLECPTESTLWTDQLCQSLLEKTLAWEKMSPTYYRGLMVKLTKLCPFKPTHHHTTPQHLSLPQV